MQTFLPLDTYSGSARVLDYRRLGKQRVETYQILRSLLGISTGWTNHPATKMWKGYEFQLTCYLDAVCTEWKNRGYKDTIQERIPELLKRIAELNLSTDNFPPFIGDEEFHRSHRSNLTRKFPEHYSKYWEEPNDLPYVWPTNG